MRINRIIRLVNTTTEQYCTSNGIPLLDITNWGPIIEPDSSDCLIIKSMSLDGRYDLELSQAYEEAFREAGYSVERTTKRVIKVGEK